MSYAPCLHVCLRLLDATPAMMPHEDEITPRARHAYSVTRCAMVPPCAICAAMRHAMFCFDVICLPFAFMLSLFMMRMLRYFADYLMPFITPGEVCHARSRRLPLMSPRCRYDAYVPAAI